jgi:hypothetical protein
MTFYDRVRAYTSDAERDAQIDALNDYKSYCGLRWSTGDKKKYIYREKEP